MPENHIPYYVKWVLDFFQHYKKSLSEEIVTDQIASYLSAHDTQTLLALANLKFYGGYWQVEQSQDSIKMF